jgi:hypothetical protein
MVSIHSILRPFVKRNHSTSSYKKRKPNTLLFCTCSHQVLYRIFGAQKCDGHQSQTNLKIAQKNYLPDVISQ